MAARSYPLEAVGHPVNPRCRRAGLACVRERACFCCVTVVAATCFLAAGFAAGVVVVVVVVVVLAVVVGAVVVVGTVVVAVVVAAVVVGVAVVVVVAAVVVGAVVVAAAQVGRAIVSVSSVTAPLRASTRPSTVTPVVTVMLVRARIVPRNVDAVPSVAELPTCQ